MELRLAAQKIRVLQNDLRQLSQRDPDQEVQGIALPVVDEVIEVAKQHVPENDPVLDRIAGVFSVETISLGESIRASDALVVVSQLKAILDELEDRQRPQAGPPW